MLSPEYTTPLEPGQFYHIYNRGNNYQKVFLTPADYATFLRKWEKFIFPVAKTFAYNLLPNHFHALIQIRDIPLDISESIDVLDPNDQSGPQTWVSMPFKNFFISFARTMQNLHGFHGAVFHSPFKRKLIAEETFFEYLTAYINCNTQKHGLSTGALHEYPYSSYRTLISDAPTFLEREFVMDYFGGKNVFIAFHERMALFFKENLRNRA